MLREKMTFKAVVAGKAGKVAWRKTTSALTAKDRFGGFLVRMDIGRHDYRVNPGLYACGNPGRSSPALVTANYKLSFDSLRKELAGIDAWILVLDTNGVNVWCAAGKGTFGTDELIARISSTGLAEKLDHRDLVLPQLGASGVAGFRVTAKTGFRVHFGPVYAKDIPSYLARGMRKSDDMGTVTFTLKERLAVAPVELVHAAKYLPVAVLAAVLFSIPASEAFSGSLRFWLTSLVGGIVAGTLLFPALLPVLPFRAFSAKSTVLGLIWCALSYLISAQTGYRPPEPMAIAAALMTVPLVAFLAMNFTGCSTFTCQKGAEREVKISALPMLIAFTGGTVFSLVGSLAFILKG